ncbi:MAG: dephospho-CoA kinase [Kiloniellales bacterium]
MLVLGLTGSIGMGKSTAVAMLRRMGLAVHDADASVRRLIGPGGAAVGEIAKAFPGMVKDGAVDRRRLGDKVFKDPKARARLETILHPLVRRSSEAFLRRQARRRQGLVVLDIPLLFETGGEVLCDAVMVVSAPASVQASRVLGRADMSEGKFRAIRAAQLSDAEKRRRADFVISTGLSKAQTLRQLTAAVTLLRQGRWRPSRGKAARRRPPFRMHHA